MENNEMMTPTVGENMNISLVLGDCPNAYAENMTSNAKCKAAGSTILERIRQQGMNDELDQAAATFISKARKTLKKMTDKRSGITRTFDTVRSRFTALEDEINVNKAGNVVHELQALRNDYAAKKKAEEERKRQEEMMRQQRIKAVNDLHQSIDEAVSQDLTIAINRAIDKAEALFRNLTLENYEDSYNKLKGFAPELAVDDFRSTFHNVHVPSILPRKEAGDLFKGRLAAKFEDMGRRFKEEVHSVVDEIIVSMPGKKVELQKLAKMKEDERMAREAEIRMKEQVAAREREEARLRAEAEARRAAEAAAAVQSANSLFDAAAAESQVHEAVVADYQPKMNVRKKIVPLNVEAFPVIIGEWWSKEGCHMSIEDLTKMFRKQITFCEKLANQDNPEFIRNEHIDYQDEVKAR